MNYNQALEHRYSVKKFDKDRIIPDEILKNILRAGQLSASSLGLQPYKIFVVASEEEKQKIIPAFLNPSQVSTCSHFIAIVAKSTIEDDYVDGYFRHISEVREIPVENLVPFRNSINHFRGLHDERDTISWNAKQAYIVLGNLMFASALEGVDTCPMEGFSVEKINEVLGLDTEKEQVAVCLALGYRASDDHFQTMKKVRKPDEKLFKFL